MEGHPFDRRHDVALVEFEHDAVRERGDPLERAGGLVLEEIFVCNHNAGRSQMAHSPDEIRACTEAILARYDDASVRSHVLTIADRQARECLQREVCNASAVS